MLHNNGPLVDIAGCVCQGLTRFLSPPKKFFRHFRVKKGVKYKKKEK